MRIQILSLFFCNAISLSGQSPQLLQPGNLNSRAPEFGASLPRNENMIFFNRTDSSRMRMSLMQSIRRAKSWSPAMMPPFTEPPAWDIDPFISPDGQTLYFSSDRAHPGLAPGFNLWSVSVKKGKWGKPAPLPGAINTADDEIYCSLARNGNLYFTRMAGPASGIFFTSLKPSRETVIHKAKIPVSDSIRLSNPAVAPDESFIVFVSGQLEGLGSADLFISHRIAFNTWSKPENLGPEINSSFAEFAPFISTDGHWLYFTSERPGVVDRFPAGYRRPGDIYKVKLNRKKNKNQRSAAQR